MVDVVMLSAAESQKFELADHAHLIGPADGAIRERFVTILAELQPHVCFCTTCNCRAAVALACILLLKIDISLLDSWFLNFLHLVTAACVLIAATGYEFRTSAFTPAASPDGTRLDH